MARIYRKPFDREDQVNRLLRRETAGSVVGHSESAAPVRLDREAAVSSASSQLVTGGVLVGTTGTVLVETFTTSGTWTKAAGARIVRMYALGAGSGGQSGVVTASGVAAVGGRGGGGGGLSLAVFAGDDLPATLTVTVGVGGAGGAATTSSTANNGGAGGDSTLTDGGNTYLRAPGGQATGATALGGVGEFRGYTGGVGGGAGANANGGVATVTFGVFVVARLNGGSGGGGVRTTNAAGTGNSGTAGTTPSGGFVPGGGGAGGNASTTVNGTNGSNGNASGAGGGGGGATRTTHTAGAGGNGSDGIIVIVTNT